MMNIDLESAAAARGGRPWGARPAASRGEGVREHRKGLAPPKPHSRGGEDAARARAEYKSIHLELA